MNFDTALRRALECVHHLNDDEPPWEPLLRAASDLFGTDGAVLIVHRNGCVDMRQTGASAQALHDYSTHFHAQDLLLQPGLARPAGIWLDTQHLLSASQRQRSSYYTDFMCKHQMRQLGAVMLDGHSADHWASLGFQRERPDDRLIERLNGPAVRRFLRALRPALGGRLQHAEHWIRSAQSLFADFDEAMLLLNDAGFVIEADTRVLDRLAAQARLQVRRRMFWHASPAMRAALAQTLRQAGQGARGARLRLPAYEGTPPVELEFALAPARMRMIGERLVLLKVRFPVAPKALDARQLQSRFGITPAEARVLAALAAGQSIAAHAQQHGSSIHTVRKQVAVLMQKMGCTRQVELVRKVLGAME